jgi:hypothetical protein
MVVESRLMRPEAQQRIAGDTAPASLREAAAGRAPASTAKLSCIVSGLR